MDINYHNLASHRENFQIEAKNAKGGFPSSVWETYSSFANTDGGIILLGVDEQKGHSLSVVGLQDAVKLEKDFWNQINNRQKTNVNILTNRMVRIETVEGKDILVVEVPRAERMLRPVYVGQDPMRGTYRRNGEGDYLCTPEEVSAMFRDAAISPMDMKVLEDMDYSVFSPETIRSYRQVFNGLHPAHAWRDLEDEVFLRRLNAIGKASDGSFHPTVAGLLMFGYEYEIRREFVHYFLDFQENRQLGETRWTDRIVSSSGEWSGNLFDYIYKVVPKLCDGLKVPFVLNGVHRKDDTPLHKLIRECVTNCCAHADFYGRRGIVIQKERDKFTFSNPGCLRMSKKEAIEGGFSDPRNETILKMLSMIDLGDRAGSGLNGVYYVWAKAYHTQPILEETIGIDRVALTLDTEGREVDMDALLSLYESDFDEALDSLSNGKVTDFDAKLTDSDKKVTDLAQNPSESDGNPTESDSLLTDLDDNSRRIVGFLSASGPQQVSAISKAVNLGLTRTKYYLIQLMQRGIVGASGTTRDRKYFLIK